MTLFHRFEKTLLKFRVIRVSHWVKNLLVFFPLIFSGRMDDFRLFLITFQVFLAFCAASSVGYIFNDWRDRELDLLHPKKKSRAIASRSVNRLTVINISLVLLAAMILVSYPLSSSFQKYLYLYLSGTILYSVALKNLPYIEILFIGFLFLCRIFAGASATNVPLTRNFTIIVVASSVYFVASKRLSEKMNYKGFGTRKVLEQYSEQFLRKICAVSLTVSVLCYLFWIYLQIDSRMLLSLTIIPLSFASIRYFRFQKKYNTENPVELFLKDKFLLMCSWVFLALIIVEIYLI